MGGGGSILAADYRKAHSMPEAGTTERIRISTQAQTDTDESITSELIYV